MSDFHKKHYSMEIKESNDLIHIDKMSGTDWSTIEMVTNDKSNGYITIRSKNMAEHLHFMLGQMLDK